MKIVASHEIFDSIIVDVNTTKRIKPSISA